MKEPKIAVVIPTYNRAYCIDKAVRAALEQTYHNLQVLVVDDGSADNTGECLKKYFDEPNFCYIKLAQNVGTAQAKNVGILFGDYDAITFHDSDDIPNQNKVLLQARALMQPDHKADDILNWRMVGHEPNSSLAIDLVVGAHEMIKLDGAKHRIGKRISLVDDFFPNVQFPSKTEGDWILINSGLFSARALQQLGGFLDSVEEDREIRNRLIGTGSLVYYLEEPLLTKIEMDVSLTVSEDTGYRGDRRRRDRQEVWDRLELMRNQRDMEALKKELQVPVDLSQLRFSYVSNPELLTFNRQIPHAPGSDAALQQVLMKTV